MAAHLRLARRYYHLPRVYLAVLHRRLLPERMVPHSPAKTPHARSRPPSRRVPWQAGVLVGGGPQGFHRAAGVHLGRYAVRLRVSRFGTIVRLL